MPRDYYPEHKAPRYHESRSYDPEFDARNYSERDLREQYAKEKEYQRAKQKSKEYREYKEYPKEYSSSSKEYAKRYSEKEYPRESSSRTYEKEYPKEAYRDYPKQEYSSSSKEYRQEQYPRETSTSSSREVSSSKQQYYDRHYYEKEASSREYYDAADRESTKYDKEYHQSEEYYKEKKKQKKDKRKQSREDGRDKKKKRPEVKALVDYAEGSSDSDFSNNVHSASPSGIPSRAYSPQSSERARKKRHKSPGTAIQEYKKQLIERSHSNSPVPVSGTRDGGRMSSPPHGTSNIRHGNSSKVAKTLQVLAGQQPMTPEHLPAAAVAPSRARPDAPKAYADPPKAYQTASHSPSPPGRSRGRYRSRSASPYSRKRTDSPHR